MVQGKVVVMLELCGGGWLLQPLGPSTLYVRAENAMSYFAPSVCAHILPPSGTRLGYLGLTPKVLCGSFRQLVRSAITFKIDAECNGNSGPDSQSKSLLPRLCESGVRAESSIQCTGGVSTLRVATTENADTKQHGASLLLDHGYLSTLDCG